MYLVGVLFGFGFDTASSIALIAVTALAKRGANNDGFAQADIVILPFLFTSAMTMVDSADSILMLYSYSGFPERGFALFERPVVHSDPEHGVNIAVNNDVSEPRDGQTRVSTPQLTDRLPPSSFQDGPASLPGSDMKPKPHQEQEPQETKGVKSDPEMDTTRNKLVEESTMSGLGIILTLISILVAFSISIITIMGLVGDKCGPCTAAAEAEDGHGGGLAGRWWRGWAKANDETGIIGAAIVGGFVAVVILWYSGRWILKRWTNPQKSATDAI